MKNMRHVGLITSPNDMEVMLNRMPYMRIVHIDTSIRTQWHALAIDRNPCDCVATRSIPYLDMLVCPKCGGHA